MLTTSLRNIYPVLGILLALAGCGRVSSPADTASEESTQKPNILFLFADDQRVGTIGAMGNSEIKTPHLDKLASQGTYFSQTYLMGSMSGAVCAPSRAMLMSGRSLYHIDPTGATIDSSHTTLPKALEAAGYHTFHTGKWHNGKDAFARSFMSGDDIFFGGMGPQFENKVFDFQPKGNYDDSLAVVVKNKHSSELFADAAINFLEGYEQDKPFFLFCSFKAPHDPREMPEAYFELYDTAKISLPQNFMPSHPFNNGELEVRDEWLAGSPRTAEEIKVNIAAYYAMITHLDEQIGRIIETLENKGLAENTIIVFSSDNGLAVGQHGLMGKQNLYQHSLGVPLVFAGAGIPVGSIVDEPNYIFDLYPTLCELAGAAIPSTVEGKSLAAALDGELLEPRNGLLFAYKHFQRAAIYEGWKIIKYNVDGQQQTQLFNLSEDPFELQNLASRPEYQAQLQGMEQKLRELMKENGDNADLKLPNWGVEAIPAWKDVVSQEIYNSRKEMAEEERRKWGFGLE